MIVTLALVASLVMLVALTVTQILLIAGAPLGHIAFGGYHRVLPPRLRVAAGVAITLYVGFAALLLARTEVIVEETPTFIILMTWALFAYFVLSIALNLASRSRLERLVQTPVAVVLALATLVIALS